MANNHTLGKKMLNKILACKNIRAANRYLQFYRILDIFGSKEVVLKKTGHTFCLKSYDLKMKMNIKDCF